MTTAKKSGADEPVAETTEAADTVEVAGEQEEVLTYRCPGHSRFFPEEDPVRPYTEFRVDPYTLRRIHDTYCRRCSREQKRSYDRAKVGRDLTPLERVRREQQRAAEKLQRVSSTSDEAGGLRFLLRHLAEQERELAGAGGDA